MKKKKIKDMQFSFVLDHDLYNQLVKISERLDCSIASVVRSILKKNISDR